MDRGTEGLGLPRLSGNEAAVRFQRQHEHEGVGRDPAGVPRRMGGDELVCDESSAESERRAWRRQRASLPLPEIKGRKGRTQLTLSLSLSLALFPPS